MSLDARPVVRSILETGGVRSHSTLIVHSAFRGFAQLGLRVETFIEALLDHLSEGTLLMPAMSWRNVQPDNPVWDEIHTKCHVGVLAETFRTGFAQRRSIHPTHSVAGWGRDLAWWLGDHHQDPTPCSPRSPFGKLAASDGFILILGLGLENCTACHCVEEEIAPEIYLRPHSEMEEYLCRDRHGVCRTVRLRRHKRIQRDFPKFEPILTGGEGLLSGDFGGAAWKLIKASALRATMLEALRRDPYATLQAEVRQELLRANGQASLVDSSQSV
jgi:aminoglycoside 3-N-acetyltransferase